MSEKIQRTYSNGTPAFHSCGCPVMIPAFMADMTIPVGQATGRCGSCKPVRPLTNAEFKAAQAATTKTVAPAPAQTTTNGSCYCRRCGGPTSIAGQLCGEC